MKESKRKYQKSCKSKVVTFYKKDAMLLSIANKINFQAFVKDALKKLMKGE